MAKVIVQKRKSERFLTSAFGSKVRLPAETCIIVVCYYHVYIDRSKKSKSFKKIIRDILHIDCG